MSAANRVLSRLYSATGLNISEAELELIFSMQDKEQNKQYQEDLQLAILIYDDAQQHGGATTEKAREKWDEVNRRIALWSTWAALTKPEKSGWFGKKKIPFAKKMMLKGLLSPNCAFVQSGALD